MKPQNELALIVAYYLSRFNREAYTDLGYSSFAEATREIGKKLSVKVATIKNMRDEFDPHHQNNRVGWLRELRGSRLKILNAFQDTDKETLEEIVKEILFAKDFEETEGYRDIHTLFSEKKSGKKDLAKATVFVSRGPTGKAAESFFMDFFAREQQPIQGKLEDCRDFGRGYDFVIRNENGDYFIEVKGLASESGGILFTNKEWKTAIREKERYYVVVIRNISTKPDMLVINNPVLKLKPRKSIYTTVQISWTVSNKELK